MDDLNSTIVECGSVEGELPKTRRRRRRYRDEPVVMPDTGCPDGMFPSCLNCPLRECKYADPGAVKAFIDQKVAEGVPLSKVFPPGAILSRGRSHGTIAPSSLPTEGKQRAVVLTS